ncbi:hypothetical protein AVEN_40254-1, partial [Araneus ventricosus]
VLSRCEGGPAVKRSGVVGAHWKSPKEMTGLQDLRRILADVCPSRTLL